MNLVDKVAVCSRSFSKNTVLRKEILNKYKHVKFNDEGLSLVGDTLKDFLQGQNKVIIGLEKIDESLLSEIQTLNVVSKYGVGIDMINLDAMKKHEVKLGWKGGVNKRAVSELVLCYAISILRHVPLASREVYEGVWQQHKGNLLTNKTFGIVGYGNIGRDVIDLLHPFDCEILVYDIAEFQLPSDITNIRRVSLEELLINSDIVSLHIPLNDQTSMIINKEKIGLMNKNAILINLSRGGLVDEQALKHALLSSQIAGAAFDVFEEEPPIDNDLIRCPNLLATPHIGGLAKESIMAMGFAAIDGLDNNFHVE
jgi:phosphoglycerate dehydrogenase-like enzyme